MPFDCLESCFGGFALLKLGNFFFDGVFGADTESVSSLIFRGVDTISRSLNPKNFSISTLEMGQGGGVHRSYVRDRRRSLHPVAFI